MSIWKPWFLFLSLTVAACGGGDDGGGGDMPDASGGGAPDAPDQAPVDAGNDQPDARLSTSLCEDYCGTVMSNCSGDNAQYDDMQSCVSTCQQAGWREGQSGDDSGNSLYCRLYHAGAPATSDPDNNCPAAGVSGGGACGSLCENYCFYVGSNCADLNPYENTSSCTSACNDLMAQDGTLDSTDTNTVQCRLNYALQAAKAGDKEAACAAANVHGADVCGSWCEVYCDLMETNCSDQPSAYPDRDTCLSTCAGFPDDGVPADDPAESMGDTVQCRIDHAGLPALRSPSTECNHAAELADNYCIDVVGEPF